MTRSLPRDPIIRQLVVQAHKTQFSRRHVLQAAGIGASALALAACAPVELGLKSTTDQSGNDKTLTWDNWASYIDEDAAGNHPTLANFRGATGIKVNYRPTIENNNSYYATIKDKLARGEDTGADTFCLTEWMVGRLIRFGYVQTLDAESIPNKKNLAPALLNPDFDPGRQKSLPWQNGFTGLAWNAEKVPGGLTTLNDLWNPALKGKVTVLSEMRDTMGVIMLGQGVDISGAAWGADQFSAAIDVLDKHVTSGQILGIKGNEYTKDLASGAAVAALAWSGDITVLNAQAGYEKWKFTLPSEGGTLWGDSFMVPIGTRRKVNVEKLINYYYEPEIAAEVAAWVHYITPVVGAQEIAQDKYPALANNQLIFPNAETLAKAHIFRTLAPADEQTFNAEFQRVQQGVK